MNIKSFLQCTIFLLSPALLFANVSFEASVNREQVGLNQTFQLTYTLQNAQGAEFQPPDLSNFMILGGPNQSSRVAMGFNNQRTQIFTISYILRPRNTGNFTIQPGRMRIDGSWTESNPVSIEVVAGEAPTTQPGQEQRQQDPMAQIPDNLYLRLHVNKNEVYVGEQLTATFKLYNRLNTGHTRIQNMPSYNGFWAEELPADQDFTSEYINGVRFNVADIVKVALYPQRAGTFRIEPMELSTNVRIQVPRQSRSFSHNPFSSWRDVPYEFKSNPVEITVKPLPEQGRPANFGGLVGNFDMEVSIDKHHLEVNDPATFTVKLSGSGNWQNVTTPKPEFSKDFEVFEPKVNRRISTRREILSGNTQYDYLLIPRRPGTFKIPSISWSFFNPDEGRYVVLKSKEIEITVEGVEATTGITGLDRREIELLSQDIRYISTGNLNLHTNKPLLIHSPGFFALYFSPLLLLLVGLVFRKKLLEKQLNPIIWKRNNALSQFQKNLKALQKNIQQNGGKEKASGELIKIIATYIGDKSGVGHPVMEKDVIKLTLTDLQVSEQTIQSLMQLLEDIELSVYAPAGSKKSLSGSMEKADEIIRKLDSEVKYV